MLWRLSDFTFTFHFHCIEEGNGNPLQCSCLGNPRDGGASWAAVYGVSHSQTWLKQLSDSIELMRWGHSSWGMSLLCSPLHWLSIKAIFLFPPNSIFFIRFRWAKKAKLLASKVISSHSTCWYHQVALSWNRELYVLPIIPQTRWDSDSASDSK